MTGRLWVLGDSWTDPEWFAWGWSAGWPTLVAQRLGLGLVNSGSSGAGYAWANSERELFGVEAARGIGAGADAVIVWGSVNDWANGQTPAAVGAAAADTYRLLRALCPGAPLLVYGPQWWETPPDAGMYPHRDAVRDAAADAGAPFVDPLHWFAGRPDLLDAAGWFGHPTRAGHAAIADRVAVDVLFALLPIADTEPIPDTAGWPAPWELTSPATLIAEEAP